jgi:hypothetical protein
MSEDRSVEESRKRIRKNKGKPFCVTANRHCLDNTHCKKLCGVATNVPKELFVVYPLAAQILLRMWRDLAFSRSGGIAVLWYKRSVKIEA